MQEHFKVKLTILKHLVLEKKLVITPVLLALLVEMDLQQLVIGLEMLVCSTLLEVLQLVIIVKLVEHWLVLVLVVQLAPNMYFHSSFILQLHDLLRLGDQ